MILDSLSLDLGQTLSWSSMVGLEMGEARFLFLSRRRCSVCKYLYPFISLTRFSLLGIILLYIHYTYPSIFSGE